MLLDLLDGGIIITLGILLYRLILKNRSEIKKLLLGYLIVFGFDFLANKIGLEKTSFVLNKATDALAVGATFVFYPEIRYLLKKLAEGAILKKAQEKNLISKLKKVVFSLSYNKIGALIILDPHQVLFKELENKVEIDAVFSEALIETIFHPNTPLHDGAVVIHNERIAFAGCKLPLTGLNIESAERLGTRHLVALETAEMHNLTIIVVSEETGRVSIVTKDGLFPVKTPVQFEDYFKIKST